MKETTESDSALFSQEIIDKQDDFRETSRALVEEENNCNKSDSDDEIFTKSKSLSKIKTKQIIDCDSDSDNSIQNGARDKNVSEGNEDSGLSDSSSKKSNKNVSTQSKRKIIRQLDSDSDESDSNNKNNNSVSSDSASEENIVQSTRIKDKRKKFTAKFQNLFSKSKNTPENGVETNDSVVAAEASKPKISNLYDSESSDDERQEQVAIVQKSFGKKPKAAKMIAARDEKPAQRVCNFYLVFITTIFKVFK